MSVTLLLVYVCACRLEFIRRTDVAMHSSIEDHTRRVLCICVHKLVFHSRLYRWRSVHANTDYGNSRLVRDDEENKERE